MADNKIISSANKDDKDFDVIWGELKAVFSLRNDIMRQLVYEQGEQRWAC